MATSLGSVEGLMSDEDTAASSSCEAGATASASRLNKKPTCVIVLGMAGSGKTTFVQVI